MTIRPPSRPFFTPTISLGKIIFRWSPLTILFVPAKFAAASRRGRRLLTNRLTRHGGSLNGDVVVENGKPADRLSLLDADAESDMARPKQSEPSLSVDRRQLLVTAAALSIGTVPGIEAAAEVTNSPGEIARSEPAAWNVCAGTARKIKEIAARNIIRVEAGLPLLSIPRELRRMKMVDDAAAFEEFSAEHQQAVWEEVLGPVREGRGEPTWRPTGFMEGLGFQAQVSKILRERFDLSQHHGQR